MTVVGWDIGGANLKQATADGRAWSLPFPLWQEPQELADQLRRLLRLIDTEISAVAITMTGELADCFATKAEGVEYILKAAEQAAAGRHLVVWSIPTGLVSLSEARKHPLSVAAANWHALATWAVRYAPVLCRNAPESAGLLIDMGSTTTDIIPLVQGRPASRGVTDPTRLQAGELLYTGIRRTPLCAILSEVVWRGQSTSVAAELFATTYDVYLLLGDLPENPADCHTANGQPATRAAAHDRLARMLCADRQELSLDEAVALAGQWARRQEAQIAACVQRVLRTLPHGCQAVILSGSGEFLARRALCHIPELADVERVSLSSAVGPATAEAAAAAAVAVLFHEARSGEKVTLGEPHQVAQSRA